MGTARLKHAAETPFVYAQRCSLNENGPVGAVNSNHEQERRGPMGRARTTALAGSSRGQRPTAQRATEWCRVAGFTALAQPWKAGRGKGI